jgi:hypothetical protein
MESKSLGAVCYIFGTVNSKHEYQLQLQPSVIYTDFSAIMNMMLMIDYDHNYDHDISCQISNPRISGFVFYNP